MAATKYTYSISTDFTGLLSGYDVPATDKLESEIQTSAIVTALDYINTSGDDCDIWFKDALSAGDETILDGLVAAHDGVPLVSPDNVVLSTPGGVANVDLLLGQERFLRIDNGSYQMNIDGRALGRRWCYGTEQEQETPAETGQPVGQDRKLPAPRTAAPTVGTLESPSLEMTSGLTTGRWWTSWEATLSCVFGFSQKRSLSVRCYELGGSTEAISSWGYGCAWTNT